MINRFLEILRIDSTSGSERALAEHIARTFGTDKSETELYEVGDGTLNLYMKWGNPQVVFCTHLDTVPPYIAPRVEGETIYGRGTCDAKGQIISMYQACLELEQEGYSHFGLLLLAGEEVGSLGAKEIVSQLGEKKIVSQSMRRSEQQIPESKYVIVGEPTENKLVEAGKGTKHFMVEIKGKKAHSGYPHLGQDAIQDFVGFVNRLNEINFPADIRLGATTFNIGRLESDNTHNIVSDSVKFRCYFRTTFATDSMVEAVMDSLRSDNVIITLMGGDAPVEFHILDGFDTISVSYGSDAPYLTNFSHRMLYGAGSIVTAHTENEQVTMAELEQSVKDLKTIFKKLI